MKRWLSLILKIAHALTKEDQVARANIERALKRRDAFRRDSEAHSHYEEEITHGKD